MANPYAQVALTYIRRPFSSWKLGILFVWLLIQIPGGVFIFTGSSGEDVTFLQLMPFAFLFVCLAVHMKDQFADSRAHLIPDFRYIHATVATAAVVFSAVILPAMFTWLLGQHSIGFVAIAVLLFGAILWAILSLSTLLNCLMFAGYIFLCTELGRRCTYELRSGRFESQAVALLVLGAAIILLGGIRLLRLNEDMPGYHAQVQWDWTGRSQMNRQAWSGEGRLLPGLGDWIAERQMARLTRHAQRASASWWSRVCRWQVGMLAGWSFWLWILGAVLYVHILTWWILTKPSRTASAMPSLLSSVLILMPAMATMSGFLRRIPMVGYELLMPVDRKTYVRQLGAAAALSHLQLWGGTGIALVLWWLLAGPQPFLPTMFAGVAALSGAFQVGIFGILVWTARYRSRWLGALAMGILFPAVMILQMRWFTSPPDQLPHEVMWVAGIIASLGLLITFDAYRRWLAADFD